MKLFSFFKKKENKVAYKCVCCGVVYDELPLCFGFDFPEHYYSIPPEEREKRIELKESLCVVDEQHFFHRGRLIIPILNHPEPLIFNVWTSISEANFNIRMDYWNDPKRIEQGPYFGWMQTYVPGYGETINIKCIAVERGLEIIPEIQVIEEDHPLKADQENGITYEKAIQIVSEILKKQHQEN